MKYVIVFGDIEFCFIYSPFSVITPEVVEATCQCLLAQAEEAERAAAASGSAQQGSQEAVAAFERKTERLILEEFGRCLTEIIDISMKKPTANSGSGGGTVLGI